MNQLNEKSTWAAGAKVYGVYCGKEFSGSLSEETRPTPDYRNVQFAVDLSSPIFLYGKERKRIYVLTNNSQDSIYLV